MKIFWAGLDRSKRIAQHFDDLRIETSKQVEVLSEIKQDGNMLQGEFSRKLFKGEINVPNVLNIDLVNKYDVVICDSLFAYADEHWDEIKIPKAFIIVDVHGPIVSWQMRVAKQLGFDICFHRFNEFFHFIHKNAKKDFKCVWLPHSLEEHEIIEDMEKVYDATLLGEVTDFYPYRSYARTLLSGVRGFHYWERPQDSIKTQPKFPIKSDYKNIIAQSKLTYTGGSIMNAPVRKYFEYAGGGAAIVSNSFRDLIDLGFEENKSIIYFDFRQLVAQMRYWTSSEFKRKEVASNAKKLMVENHMTTKRVKQMLKEF